MITADSLTRATLDTLPFNIAVLDDEGTILFTNSSWREFGREDGDDDTPDMIGENYFEHTDENSDLYAKQAASGIEAVIDGDEDLFRLEYPCHTDDEDRWFLMRVTTLTDTDEGAAVVAHIDITERKLAEIAAQRRAEELAVERRNLEHLLDRLSGLVRNVMDAIVRSDSRKAIETAVCEEFAAVAPYELAWFGRPDFRADTVSPSAWAGTGELDDELTVALSPAEEANPTALAVETDDPVVRTDTAVGAGSRTHAEICPDAKSFVALPVSYNEARYGALHLYSEESDTFDERELTVLRALSGALSTAINAVESRRMLTADNVVELDVAVADPEVAPSALSTATGGTLEYNGAVSRSDGTTLLFVTVDGVADDAVQTAADEQPAITHATPLSTLDGVTLFEFGVTDSALLSLLADFGAELTGATATDGVADLSIELAARSDARGLVDRLEVAFDDVEVLAYRQHEQPATTRREFVAQLEDRLTDRQLTALQKSYVGGFFEWPRAVDGDELAETMDISPSTFHQHLRVAERKLLTAFFEE